MTESSSAPPSSVELIEALAPRAWPAGSSLDLDGWTLRRTPGEPTRRANSVLPNAHVGALRLEEKIDAIEAFYAETGQAPKFQITPLAAPRSLDEELERRGYLTEAPTIVMTAELADLDADRSADGPIRTILLDHVDDAWLETWSRGQPGAMPDVTRTLILERIEPTTIYARAMLDGRSAAVGLGVLDAGWIGIYCVATAPDMRRRGAARSLMTALLQTAAKRGAARAYLGVLEENAAARGLYEQLGFKLAYRYWYRWLRPGSRPASPTGNGRIVDAGRSATRQAFHPRSRQALHGAAGGDVTPSLPSRTYRICPSRWPTS